MNKEGVIKYNELLIKYLNDFVNNIERKSDLKDRSINDAIEKLERLLLEFNIIIDRNQIKQVIDNSFVMYSNILKTSFDNAGIHRIDESLSLSELARDMNEVTTNLSKAVNNINKIPEYSDMIIKIKGTILYLISQTNPNYVGHEYDVDQILNDAIGTFYSIYTETLINDFSRENLPELFKLCDEINYVNSNVDTTIDESYPNEDRDNFISKTMEIEIKEGMKDGKVTLTIVDSMGNRTELIGNAAIEKLKSYNQLYESSNPGRKADTSNWPDEPYEMPKNVEIKQIPTQVMDPTPQAPVVEIAPPPTSFSNDFNDLTAPSGVSSEPEETKNENEEMIKNFLNQYKNDTLATPAVDYEDNKNEDVSNITIPVNQFIPTGTIEETTTPPPAFIDNQTQKTNSFLPTYDTPVKTTYGDEFIGNYSNPNYDRDQFIKLTTGIEIQEDIDHQGRLFLRVIEPTGREVIYSGKEAVRMIQNYNRTYLDANPDKKVDTTLIDNYKE